MKTISLYMWYFGIIYPYCIWYIYVYTVHSTHTYTPPLGIKHFTWLLVLFRSIGIDSELYLDSKWKFNQSHHNISVSLHCGYCEASHFINIYIACVTRSTNILYISTTHIHMHTSAQPKMICGVSRPTIFDSNLFGVHFALLSFIYVNCGLLAKNRSIYMVLLRLRRVMEMINRVTLNIRRIKTATTAAGYFYEIRWGFFFFFYCLLLVALAIFVVVLAMDSFFSSVQSINKSTHIHNPIQMSTYKEKRDQS